ncbi:MAG: OmpA family protein [Bacteroidales bacterium]
MKRKQEFESDASDSSFGLSIGDLMASLLLLFVLLLAATLLNLQNQYDDQLEVAAQYTEVKSKIYDELHLTFKDSLSSWQAEIDSTELVVRFTEPGMLFDNNQSNLKPEFKKILADFFPRYINVLNKSEFRDNIEEIRIEGHTDSNGDYFYNMKLSQDRTRSTLEYSMQQLSPDMEHNWVQKRITANGLSSSKPILYKDGSENKQASRRVEFRIRTNAERQIERILKFGE